MDRRIAERRAESLPHQYMVMVTSAADCHLCYGPFTSDVIAYVWADNRWPVPADMISPWKVIPLLSTEIR